MSFTRLFERTTKIAGLCGLFWITQSSVVHAATQSMITASPYATASVQLNSVSQNLIKRAADQGALPDSQVLSHLHLSLNRPAEAQQALERLALDQVNPRSPNYHQWLTPTQIGAKYGMSQSDINQITTWLTQQGLTVTKVEDSRNQIEFSGSVARINAAFKSSLHAYVTPAGPRISSASGVSLPAAFSQAVLGVRGLQGIRKSDFKRPDARRSPRQQMPNFFFSDNGKQYLALGPTDLATMYRFDRQYAKGINGKGVSVVIAGQANVDQSLIDKYLQSFKITRAPIVSMPVNGEDPGGAVSEDTGEAYLDVDMVASLAPGANVITVNAVGYPNGGGVVDSIAFAVNRNLGGIMSVSYDGDEASSSEVTNAYTNVLFAQAAAQGITVLVASGDAGSTTLDQNSGAPAVGGLRVGSLASSPFVLAVGGTEVEPVTLRLPANNPANGNLNSYINEYVWNQSCINYSIYTSTAADPLAFCNQHFTNDLQKQELLEPGATGGGISSCVFDKGPNGSQTCESGNAQPSWQANVVGIQNWRARTIPDIAMMASDVIVCTPDSPSCDLTLDPYIADNAGNYPYDIYGGTSAATPISASALALLEQTQISATNKDGRMGLLNPMLYQLAATQYGTSANSPGPLLASCNSANGVNFDDHCVFHDITIGNNSSPCDVAHSVGGPTGALIQGMCSNLGHASYTVGVEMYNNQIAYPATPGYDLTTGLGTLNVDGLVTAVQFLRSSPTNLAVTPAANGVTLSWAALTGATSYNVYQASSSQQETTVTLGNQSSNSVTLTNLTPGATYYFKVSGLSLFGESALSPELVVIATPPAPISVTASSSPGSVDLTWQASASATGYTVYQGSAAGQESSTAVLSNVTKTSATVSGLKAGQTYYFTVTAQNAGGSSVASSEVSQVVVPNAPTGVTATGGDQSITVSWSASTGATGYNVYLGPRSGQEAATPAATNVTGTSVTISGLTSGTTYYVAVAAVNAGGTSTGSTEAAVTTNSKGGGGAMDLLALSALGGLLMLRRRRVA